MQVEESGWGSSGVIGFRWPPGSQPFLSQQIRFSPARCQGTRHNLRCTHFCPARCTECGSQLAQGLATGRPPSGCSTGRPVCTTRAMVWASRDSTRRSADCVGVGVTLGPKPNHPPSETRHGSPCWMGQGGGCAGEGLAFAGTSGLQGPFFRYVTSYTPLTALRLHGLAS